MTSIIPKKLKLGGQETQPNQEEAPQRNGGITAVEENENDPGEGNPEQTENNGDEEPEGSIPGQAPPDTQALETEIKLEPNSKSTGQKPGFHGQDCSLGHRIGDQTLARNQNQNNIDQKQGAPMSPNTFPERIVDEAGHQLSHKGDQKEFSVLIFSYKCPSPSPDSIVPRPKGDGKGKSRNDKQSNGAENNEGVHLWNAAGFPEVGEVKSVPDKKGYSENLMKPGKDRAEN
jgi:hypothetical protein